MILSFAIFKGKNETALTDILLISLGSVIGWCILTANSFFVLSNSAYSQASIAIYGNMVSLSLLISISILSRNKKFIYISLILSIFLSLTSGLRRQILIFVITLVISLIFRFQRKIKMSLKAFLVIALFLFVVIASFGKIEKYIEDRAPLLYYRVFTRTEQFITGKFQESDQYRSKVIKSYFADIKSYLFPRGFVSKRTLQDKGAGLFMDFPFIELSYMLGIFLLLLFIISYFYYIYRHIRSYILTDNYENAVWAVSGIVLIFLTFLDGTFLNYAFITPLTGLVLGKLYTIR
jgi:hypothetical protein